METTTKDAAESFGQQPKRKILPRKREDFLTIFEKTWRDWILSPITIVLFKLNITPNMVTSIGGILILLSVVCYVGDVFSSKTHFYILFIALITDLIDGSLARNHSMVTAFGIWFDRIRDCMWVVWTSYILYLNGLISIETVIILFSFDILIGLVVARDIVINFLKSPIRTFIQITGFMKDYSLDKLQPNIFGRANFALWGMSYVVYLASAIFEQKALESMAYVLLIFAIVFGALRLYRAFASYFALNNEVH